MLASRGKIERKKKKKEKKSVLPTKSQKKTKRVCAGN
jgi:hypothetical protein